ncbi:MAG: gliding motility-associated C-terminal domain-containing protein, partial [Bacteroidales bacterium]|nr:gliding motility-associated C-terminal domain-containing protein [Bacteroidales bacterium]
NDAAINLTAATNGGTWSGTGITNPTNGTFDPTSAGVGTHTITYNVGTGTCAGTGQIDITVNPSPIVTITDPGDFCSTDVAMNLTATPAGGIWSGNGITNPAAGTFKPSTANIGANDISYQVTLTGCAGTDNVIINVFDTPNATITSNPGTLCSNDDQINLTAATSGGTWSGNGITNPTNGTFDPSTAGAGTHTIIYNVGTGACAGTGQIDITVNATPIATITSSGDFCSTDAAVDLTATPLGGAWTGTGITNANAGTFNPAEAIIGENNITYTLSNAGCVGTDNAIISVFETPNPTITNPGILCSNDGVITLSAATNGGTWTGNGITNPTTGTFNTITAGAGTHTITYNVGTGVCADTDQINITVNPSPIVTITNPGDFCSTDIAMDLTATPAGGSWTGTGITNNSAGTFSPASASIGENNITYALTIAGCTGTDNIAINVATSPNVNISPAGPFCFDYITVQLTAASAGGTWSGAGMSSNGKFDLAQAGVGIHQINYEFSGNCGGIGTIDIQVFPSDIYAHYITYNPICIGGKDGHVEFSINGGTAPYMLEWGEDSSTESNIIPNLIEGNYTVTVVDYNGCTIEVDDIIIENGNNNCLNIPNAFTPNGDGINDEWIIENIHSFASHSVNVFNRWGQEIYSGNLGSDPWDGTYNGKLLPTGSYVYIVEVDEISQRFVGIVTLIK